AGRGEVEAVGGDDGAHVGGAQRGGELELDGAAPPELAEELGLFAGLDLFAADVGGADDHAAAGAVFDGFEGVDRADGRALWVGVGDVVKLVHDDEVGAVDGGVDGGHELGHGAVG